MNPYALIERSELMGMALSATDAGLSITCQSTPDVEALLLHLEFHETAVITALQTPPARLDTVYAMSEQSRIGDYWWRIPPTEKPTDAPKAPIPDIDAMIGTIVTAQRFYELQQATAQLGMTLHGARAGVVIDGYCDDWQLSRLVDAEKQ